MLEKGPGINRLGEMSLQGVQTVVSQQGWGVSSGLGSGSV